jgi:UDP-2,3-diacylglucosamine pyrophosphatase LpxH
MARLTRRSVLAGAAVSTAALGAEKVARAAGVRSKLVFISDVHIGDNSPTVWYQQKYHEPYLLALFDHVIANADSIQELIVLGDFVDFWTYPPERRPPSFAEIAAANPAVLGPKGALARAVRALNGRVTYIPGNHDMTITQADLNGAGLRQIKLIATDAYFPLGADRSILCAHGHHGTMFNAPDTTTRLAPIPVGHFATRSFCHQLSRMLKPGQTVADLADQGIPNGLDLGGLIRSVNSSLIETVVNYASNQTGLGMNDTIVMPNGDTTTMTEVKHIYRSLWSRWQEQGGDDSTGQLVAIKAALADVKNGDYLPWFAQRQALMTGANLVVYGHTHIPVRGLKDGAIDYVNTGFDCASMPDMPTRHFTFIELDIPTKHAQIMQVSGTSDSYAVEPYDHAKLDEVVPSPAEDFSTYVTIDNRAGADDLTLTSSDAKKGYFVVPPPARVPRGQIARFWIQDKIGGAGTEGTAIYQGANGPVSLRFGCPTGMNGNLAAGADFRARSGSDKSYGTLNDRPHFGHPFYVQFVTA